MLKKVAKTESRLAKFDKEKLKKSGAFRDQLKSTGKALSVIDFWKDKWKHMRQNWETTTDMYMHANARD